MDFGAPKGHPRRLHAGLSAQAQTYHPHRMNNGSIVGIVLIGCVLCAAGCEQDGILAADVSEPPLFQPLSLPDGSDGVRPLLTKCLDFVQGERPSNVSSLRFRVRVSVDGAASVVQVLARSDGSLRMTRYKEGSSIPNEFGTDGMVGWALDPGASCPRLVDPPVVRAQASIYSPLAVLEPVFGRRWLFIEALPTRPLGSRNISTVRFHGVGGSYCDLLIDPTSGEPLGTSSSELRHSKRLTTQTRWLQWRSYETRRYPSIIQAQIDALSIGYIVEDLKLDCVAKSETALPPEVVAIAQEPDRRETSGGNLDHEAQPSFGRTPALDRPADWP